jgi:hypothetical protein
MYRFRINSTPIDEPFGWDGVEFILKRATNNATQPDQHGVDRQLTSDLTFTGEAGVLLRDLYQTDFIDADATFTVEVLCAGEWTDFYQGVFNFMFYSYQNGEVTIKIEPSTFDRIFKSRINTPVDLAALLSLDGDTISNIQPKAVGLHSKTLRDLSGFRTEEQFSFPEVSGDAGASYSSALNIFCPLLTIKGIVRTFDPPVPAPRIYETDGNIPGDVLRYGSFIQAEQGGTYTLDAQLSGSLHFRWNDGTLRFEAPIFFAAFKVKEDGSNGQLFGATQLYGTLATSPSCNFGTGLCDTIINFSTNNISIEVDAEATDFIGYVFYCQDIHIRDSIFDEVGVYVTLNINSGSYAIYYADSTYKPTTVKGYCVHEAFAKICETITGQVDCFRSDYFGKLDSQPRQYDEVGIGAYNFITTGKNIRNMLDKNNVPYPIQISFSELFQALNAVHCLGWNVEYDNGVPYIRVENRSYFYRFENDITLNNVANITYSPATAYIIGDVTIGYDKYQLNFGEVNGFDEFNSQRDYRIGVKKAKEQTKAISKLISAGHVIEQTRRRQYSINDSKDFETDDNFFLICLNQQVVTTDLYTDPPVITSYQAGEVSERAERFTQYDNIIVPTKSYNLRITPARNMQRWLNWFKSSLFRKSEPKISFQAGKANFQPITQLINTDNEYDLYPIDEEADFTNDSNNLITATPDYVPIIASFSYPITQAEFNTIVTGGYKNIKFSCDGANYYYGYILSLKYQPNAPEGGIAEFELLTTYPLGEAYSDGYSDGYS